LHLRREKGFGLFMVTPAVFMPPSPLDLRIAFISTYPPRRCGIGTYTKDLATGINTLNPERLAEIIAMDDAISEKLDYPWEVSRRVRQYDWEDYERVLDYLNNSIIDVVSIQHEFGIFGGPEGDFIVRFVRELKKPFVITLHTVPSNPLPKQKEIIQELVARANGVVVMLSVARDILRDSYSVPPEKVVPIHHGTPDFPFADEEAKRQLGLENNIVMSSVNLISEGKGIEYAIEAMPEVVKQYPNFLYLIVGQTHPVILHREGEVYRNTLEALVKKHKLEKNVRFINEYVSLDELTAYVRASDFYITPYENMEQISSGSLAYAIAAGKLCISTSYRYAQEMLAGGAGYLVDAKNASAITQAILHGLEHPQEAFHMRRKCYAHGRRMIWARVGFSHLRMLEHVLQLRNKPSIYSKPSLSYLRLLTHELGLLEHSSRDKPNFREGYTVDDNARALIAAIQYGAKDLAQVYLEFLISAESNGKIYCDMDGKGKFVSTPGVGDWFGRAFWAASYAMRYGSTVALRKRATELVRRLLPSCNELKFLRTYSYVLLGLACLKDLEWDEYIEERDAILAKALALLDQEFKNHSESNWRWPEGHLTYDNARIPYAVLEIARSYNDPRLKALGLQLLDFVLDQTFDILENHFRFVGNGGWYKKGESKALFDEQPIEAGSTVQACYVAYRLTGLGYYREMAKKAMAWYHGDNILRRPLYNSKRDSVFDGMSPYSVNHNQGAESILEYLLAYTCYAKLIDEGMFAHGITYATSSNRAVTPAAKSSLGS
jgi:glycosyltransferase involved in cell wall biosynthesis